MCPYEQMRKTKIYQSFWIAKISYLYWIYMTIYVFKDWYLSDVNGFIPVWMVVPVLCINIAGAVMGWNSDARKSQRMLSLYLNLLPFAGIALFFLWLFFGVRI